MAPGICQNLVGSEACSVGLLLPQHCPGGCASASFSPNGTSLVGIDADGVTQRYSVYLVVKLEATITPCGFVSSGLFCGVLLVPLKSSTGCTFLELTHPAILFTFPPSTAGEALPFWGTVRS